MHDKFLRLYPCHHYILYRPKCPWLLIRVSCRPNELRDVDREEEEHNSALAALICISGVFFFVSTQAWGLSATSRCSSVAAVESYYIDLDLIWFHIVKYGRTTDVIVCKTEFPLCSAVSLQNSFQVRWSADGWMHISGKAIRGDHAAIGSALVELGNVRNW